MRLFTKTKSRINKVYGTIWSSGLEKQIFWVPILESWLKNIFLISKHKKAKLDTYLEKIFPLAATSYKAKTMALLEHLFILCFWKSKFGSAIGY